MVEGKRFSKEFILLLSVESQPTKAVLAQTCINVFFILIQVLECFFFKNFLRTAADHSLIITSLKHSGICMYYLLQLSITMNFLIDCIYGLLEFSQ
jgi:hypothetical protein